MEEYIFDFEKLEVYQKAIDYANEIFNLTKKFSMQVQSSLGDQFRRSSLSICNNIAEGSGKRSSSAKRQYYSIALDSARECIPILTVSLVQNQLTSTKGKELRKSCIDICRMLFKLIASTK